MARQGRANPRTREISPGTIELRNMARFVHGESWSGMSEPAKVRAIENLRDQLGGTLPGRGKPKGDKKSRSKKKGNPSSRSSCAPRQPRRRQDDIDSEDDEEDQRGGSGYRLTNWADVY